MAFSKRHLSFQAWSCLLAIALLPLISTTDLYAQKVKREIVVVSYLYQLAKNIHWSHEVNISKYHFHIIDNDRQVYEQFKKISREIKLHGKPVSVSFSSTGDIPASAHVLYVGNKKGDFFEKLSDKIGNNNLLMVSNGQENKRLIMINLYKNIEGQLRFEINRANILNQGLSIDPDIILLGGTEIDVAKLFREAQVSLKDQENLIRQQKLIVSNERAKIAELVNKAQQEQKIIEQLDKSILEQQSNLQQTIEKAKAQDQIIEDQKTKVEEAKKRYTELAKESEGQQKIIEQQKKAVIEQQVRLEQTIDKASEQERIIETQKVKVENEKTRYAELANESEGQQKIIEQQKNAVIDQQVRLEQAIEKTTEQEKIIEAQKVKVKNEKTRYAELAKESEGQQKFINQQGKAVIEQNALLLKAIEKTEGQEQIIGQQRIRVEEEQKRYAKLAQQNQEQQRFIEQQKKEVRKEEVRFTQLSKKVNEQQLVIKGQSKSISRERLKLDKAVKTTLNQEQIIKEQSKRVEEEQKRYLDLARESKEQQEILNRQKEQADLERQKYESLTKSVQEREISLEEQARKIKAREAILKVQDDKIDNQKIVISKQENSLANQSKTISSQQNFLYALGAAVFLLCVLAYAIYRGYRNKNEINAQLEEQKRLLEQSTALLVESERKYHDYYQHTPDLQVSVDAETGEIIECNETAAKATGYTKSEITGKKVFDMYHPDSLKHAQKCFKQFTETGEVHDEELQLKRKDGTAIDVVLSVTSYVSPDGKQRYSRSVWHDITQRKKAEEAQLLANEALEAANKKLQELDNLKSLFIASMSHELRTPLNSIIGFTGIVLKEMTGKLEPKQKDFLQRAYKSSKHLLDLISDVIDISKIESGVIDAYPACFSLNKVLSEVMESAEDFKKPEVQLAFNASSDIEMYSDRKRIYQCTLNLLSNAIKYTLKGEIKISTREIDNYAEIIVQDTGIGISDSDLPKLFQPFERLNTPLRITEMGTGLGLHLTNKLARNILGGRIEVKSQLGIGSTFYLKIPKKIHHHKIIDKAPYLEKSL